MKKLLNKITLTQWTNCLDSRDVQIMLYKWGRSKQYYKQAIMKISHKGTPTVVGIDMGAFSTKIAAVQRGAIDVITNQANFRETPSVVGYGEGERKIGELGSVKLKSNFKNTVVSPTRYLGLRNEGEHVKLELDNCPCPTKFQNETLHFKVSANGIDESFSPEQILASFLTKLQSIIEHNELDDKLIVFSVPPFFTQIQRKALLNAAQMAGLNNVKLVSETVAIALDYGGFKKQEMSEGKNVIFIDFGHSKLSVSAIKFTEGKMEVVYEKADRNIGCRDIDRKVFEYMSKKFEQKTSLNIKQSKRACLKLLQAIQRQRKILSGIAQTDISVESLFEDEDFSETFTRETLLSSAIDIFEQITKLLQSFKQEAQKLGIKMDSVELVGGGSRIPKFIEIVEQIFGMSTSRTINSSETIARGATLAAVQQSAIFRFDTFAITNRSLLGINLSYQSESDEQETKQVVLAPNEIIAAEKVIRIPQQSKKQIILSYEGASPQVEHRILRIQIVHTDKKSQQKSEEASQQADQSSSSAKKELSITIKITEEGLITVSSVVNSENKPIKFHIHPYLQLTSQQISTYKAKQKQMFAKDFHTVRSYEKKNQLEAFIYKQREAINKDEFKKYVTADQLKKLEDYFNQMTESLADEESNKWTIKDYEKKKSEVDKEIKDLDEIVKKRKQTLVFHYKELQNLKAQAASTIAQIQQRYRNSKPVAQTCQGIKQIENWADSTLKQSKTKNISELPLVSKEEIEQQHQNIKALVNQLLNPQRPKQPQQAPKQQQQVPKQQQPPRHQHYQQQYDPQQRYRQQQRQQQQQQQKQQQQQRRQPQYYYEPEDPMTYSGYRRPQQQYYQQPQYYIPQQSQQQQRRKQQQQQQQYDPFGMSRSGFFGSGSGFFGNSSGFW